MKTPPTVSQRVCTEGRAAMAMTVAQRTLRLLVLAFRFGRHDPLPIRRTQSLAMHLLYLAPDTYSSVPN